MPSLLPKELAHNQPRPSPALSLPIHESDIKELSMLRLITLFVALLVAHSGAIAHDDLTGREKEFRYGYQVGYVTALRESNEGTVMCTKDVPLLEVIQALGAYNKSKGISRETAFTVKNITDALSEKYKCVRP